MATLNNVLGKFIANLNTLNCKFEKLNIDTQTAEAVYMLPYVFAQSNKIQGFYNIQFVLNNAILKHISKRYIYFITSFNCDS